MIYRLGILRCHSSPCSLWCVGFDPEEVKQRDDGRSHVGMENTRKRLKDMCGATITVTSTVGEGTEVRVTIPKADKENSEVRQS